MSPTGTTPHTPTAQLALPLDPASTKAAAHRDALVGGRTFLHGRDHRVEWYRHVDPATDWLWTLRRFTDPEAPPACREVWCAYVCSPGPEGSHYLLNHTTTREGETLNRGPLADVDDRDHEALLAAMLPLIERGEWPQDAPHDRITVISNHDPLAQFLPDTLERLFERLDALTLDPACEARGDDLFRIMPNGDARAAGKFLDTNIHFCVYGPPSPMRPLGEAVERARAASAYREALARHPALQ